MSSKSLKLFAKNHTLANIIYIYTLLRHAVAPNF